MIRRVLTDRLSWALLALCLVLTGLVALQLRDQASPEVEAGVAGGRASEPETASEAAEAMQFPPLSAYQEVVERPLFARDRRPPPEDEKDKWVASTGPVPQYQLEGTVVSGAGSFVILHGRNGSREMRRLRLGEQLENWTVVEVGEGWTRLEQGERSVRLELDLPGASTNGSEAAQTVLSQGRLRGPIPPR